LVACVRVRGNVARRYLLDARVKKLSKNYAARARVGDHFPRFHAFTMSEKLFFLND
jgi:hypothetical protein